MQPPSFNSQVSQAYNVYVNPYGMRRLAPAFQPGSFDVLCARGKLAYDHEGNCRFRALVKHHQKQYSAAGCKYEKSKIVSYIVSAVRSATPHGGFVKNIDGAWYEVGDRHAKEKVGQTFRDLLHTKYSSSTKAKARARMQKRTETGPEDMEDEAEGHKQQKRQKRKSKPQAVPSGSPSDDLRSSVSVVSENSMDTDETTLHRNQEMPPLNSVVVNTKQQRPQPPPPIVSPPQPQRQTSNLMDTLRSSINTFDGRDSATARLTTLQHPGAHFRASSGVMAAVAGRGRPPMEVTVLSDLEPLPLGPGVNFTDNFHESSSTIQTEQSFEDVMSDFCISMNVPV